MTTETTDFEKKWGWAAKYPFVFVGLTVTIIGGTMLAIYFSPPDKLECPVHCSDNRQSWCPDDKGMCHAR